MSNVVDTYLSKSSVKVFVRYLDFFSFSKSSLTVVVSLSKKRRRGRASGAFFANVTVDAVLPVRRDDGTPNNFGLTLELELLGLMIRDIFHRKFPLKVSHS